MKYLLAIIAIMIALALATSTDPVDFISHIASLSLIAMLIIFIITFTLAGIVLKITLILLLLTAALTINTSPKLTYIVTETGRFAYADLSAMMTDLTDSTTKATITISPQATSNYE